MPDPIERNANSLDLSRRFLETHTVVASPSGSTETIIASLTISDDLVITRGVFLEASAAYTVGTSGVSGNLRIRQTNASGAIIAATGALTVAATNLANPSVQGVDAAAVLPGQIYVVTLTVGSGAATSTVSAVSLFATIV